MRVVKTRWAKAVRIIRSIFPPIHLFEDIADPADWPAIMAAEQKTNPRLAERLGEVERVPPGRRVGGAGAVEHFEPAVAHGADAVLAASVFHYGELTIGDVKGALAAAGHPVR